MKYFFLLLLGACASYTDPESEKLTYYKCERGQEIVTKHSDDYGSLRVKVGQEQLLLHHFVMENGDGYRADNYLFITRGKEAKLMHLNRDGVEVVVLGECRS